MSRVARLPRSDKGIRFGLVAEKGAAAHWIPLRHAHFDGVGGFAHLVAEVDLGHDKGRCMSCSDLPLPSVDAIVVRALEEDLGAGDVTTDACIPAPTAAKALAVARSGLVACGIPVAERVFRTLDPSVKFSGVVEEGKRVPPGTTLFTVEGRARTILKSERVALNLMQRMCGIATATRRHVDAVAPGAKTRITDTRKTTPGLRLLERYAVRCGGGHNHRNDLGSAVLIKDNHIVACGGVAAAIRAARAHAPHTSKVECEVDSLEQLEEALAAGADIVLLDNMDTAAVREAVARTRGRALLEASGGITLERIRELSEAGVDAISVGALTHSTPAADIGLDFVS
jgi:nicotinate-nucleotide pyrophosphorylase (carboxylating)